MTAELRYGHECSRATLALALLFLAPVDGIDDGDGGESYWVVQAGRRGAIDELR
jgi:hypothetical protein